MKAWHKNEMIYSGSVQHCTGFHADKIELEAKDLVYLQKLFENSTRLSKLPNGDRFIQIIAQLIYRHKPYKTQSTNKVTTMNCDLQKEFKLVAKMNEAFGNNNDIYTTNPSRLIPQIKNVLDELNEYKTHFEQYKNQEISWKQLFKEIRDDLTDMKVFAYGLLHFLGRYGIIDENELDTSNTLIKSLVEWYSTKDTPHCYVFDRYEYLVKKAIIPSIEHYISKVSTQPNLFSDMYLVRLNTLALIREITALQIYWGINPYSDMEDVITGVMTRFIKSEDDLSATKKIFEAKGVTEFYTEGNYPTMILKSAVDQPDAPKGKFLKAASYQDTQFKECPVGENFPDYEVITKTKSEITEKVFLAGKETTIRELKGIEVSVDISTGDQDIGRRVFGVLTGEVNDGVLLAEGYVNKD